jgi:hypothetical protein
VVAVEKASVPSTTALRVLSSVRRLRGLLGISRARTSPGWDGSSPSEAPDSAVHLEQRGKQLQKKYGSERK